MPRVLDEVLETAVYLYPDRPKAEAGEQMGGTGFLLAETQSPRGADFWIGYVITNRHIIDDGSTVVRVNAVAGGFEILELTERDWICAADGSDIAVAVIELDDKIHRARMVTQKYLLTPELAAHMHIGPGDEVLMVGRFVNHEGMQRNIPTVRFGAIAQMADDGERISCPPLAPQLSYLVEMRAIGGYSGSPVFIQLPLERTFGPSGIAQRVLAARRQSWLLGIEWCMIPEWVPVHGENHKALKGLKVPVHTGVCGVIPSWKIGDLLKDVRVTAAREPIERSARSAKPGAILTRLPNTKEDFTDDEAAQRAFEAARRSFALPHKTLKNFVGKTPRAKAMARKRKAKDSQKLK